jgi:hypothetical protein
MAMYVLFLQNLATQEEFVAGIDAAGMDAAKLGARVTYPAKSYALLTCYAQAELETILTNLKRWPGVPSKVQPAADEVNPRVQVSVGKLPPLKREQPTEGRVAPVQAEELSAMMQMMARQSAERLRREQAERGEAPALQPADRVAEAKAVQQPQAAPVQRQSVLEALKGIPASKSVSPTAMASPAGNSGKSVVELLRGLRG